MFLICFQNILNVYSIFLLFIVIFISYASVKMSYFQTSRGFLDSVKRQLSVLPQYSPMIARPAITMR